MPKKPFFEIDEERGVAQQINHQDERVADIAIYDWKRYDRDALGLPPVFIFRENENNISLNIELWLNKKSLDVMNALEISHEDFICFHETKDKGLQRLTYQKANIDLTPQSNLIVNKTAAKADDVDKELSRGMSNIYSQGLKEEMQKDLKRQGANQGTPSLEDAFFGDLASEKKKKI